jgi:C4-dicarboxylate-specific signal transduction histidine kinase
MERKYAPYVKWFGTAFSKLESAQALTPIFMQIMDASTWQERQDHLTKAYEQVAKMHNELGITDSLNAQVSRFHNRPFMIIQADDFADAIHAKIEDDEVKQLPKYLGGIDQYVDSTDVLSYTATFRRFWSMYQ